VILSRLRATCVAGATVAAALTAAACGSDSTGPNITPTQIVQHYDALAGQYLAGTGTNPNIGQNIEVFNGILADGSPVSNASILGTTFSRGWLSDVADLVDSAGTDSLQVVSLWLTGGVTATIQLFYVDTSFVTASVIDSGSAQVQDSVGAATISVAPASANTCSFITITHISTEFPTFDPSGSACQLITGSFSADSILLPQADTSSTSVFFARLKFLNQTIKGARLQFNHEADFSIATAYLMSHAARGSAALRRVR
jgi:hypothetical protein